MFNKTTIEDVSKMTGKSVKQIKALLDGDIQLKGNYEMGGVITNKELKKQVRRYNRHLLPDEPPITETEYCILNNMIRIPRNLKPAKITLARLKKIIKDDRDNEHVKTVHELQCYACNHRIIREPS